MCHYWFIPFQNIRLLVLHETLLGLCVKGFSILFLLKLDLPFSAILFVRKYLCQSLSLHLTCAPPVLTCVYGLRSLTIHRDSTYKKNNVYICII